MVELATGHQVCCMLWVQVAVFNKGIGFLYGSKFFETNIVCENTYNQVYVNVVNMLQKSTVKDGPIYNYEHQVYSGKMRVLSSSPNIR